jgi:uncharacterized membrane protein
MVDVKKELGQIAKSLSMLTTKMEKLAKQLDRQEKGRASVKKQRRPTKKKTAAKRTAGRAKSKKVTAIDTVLDIIKRRKGGVTTTQIKSKTGFPEKKIWDIINRAKRQGVVKSASKGVYIYTK